MPRSNPSSRIVVLVATLHAATFATAVGDPSGDATDAAAEHDLLEFRVRETATELWFTARVAGVFHAPVSGVEEVRIAFTIVPGGFAPGAAAVGLPHEVGVSGADEYAVFRVGGFGYTLPIQPDHLDDTATWRVPKAYLDATAASRPAAGDLLRDIAVETLVLGMPVDRLEHPDLVLALDEPEGLLLYLRGETLGPRTLAAEAATDLLPTSAALFDGVLQAEWTTPPLRRDVRLRDVSAFLWLTPTTTTPVLADEELVVELYALDTQGQRTLLAVRAEAVSPSGDTNLYLVPGVPQRMPFRLAPLADTAPAGAALALQVRVGGFLAEESGPLLLHYDSGDLDSFLALGRSPPPRLDHVACPAGNAVAELPKAKC